MDTLSAPHHVAIIMDGNGRWAKKRRKPRSFGHHAGQKNIDKIIECALLSGVRVLTLFAFSIENWQRPEKEVRTLLSIFEDNLQKKAEDLAKEGICLRVLGSRQGFSERLCAEIDRAEKITAQGDKLELVLAFNYSGHWAILQTIKNLSSNFTLDRLASLTVQEFESMRPINSLPAVDLLIRTSGEMRLSNFLLWEMAYAELYFTEVLWPDFDDVEFLKALNLYRQRERRFGAVGV